ERQILRISYDSVHLPSPSFKTSDGELNLTCTHPSVTDEWISWYRQFPRQGLQFIVQGYSKTSPSTEPEGILHISEDRKSSTLSLRHVRLADAAVYYCALRDTVRHTGAAPYN
uniref:Ig-like domain-containing protein n=1 Tax=Pelusios castaneus TaxID=367368 RepID=A0A8C8VNH5_9SAUR